MDMDIEPDIFEKVVEKYNSSEDTIKGIRLVMFNHWRVVDAAKEVGKTRSSLSYSLSMFKRRMQNIKRHVDLLVIKEEWEALSATELREKIIAVVEKHYPN